jgi:hypothetical protein
MSAIERYDFEILYGSTGGFTNTNPIYIIKSDGDILKKDKPSSAPNPLKRINRHKIDSLYLLIKESDFCNLKIKEISNFTHYIEIKSDRCNNKVMWFDASQLPDNVKKLYDSLKGVIQN